MLTIPTNHVESFLLLWPLKLWLVMLQSLSTALRMKAIAMKLKRSLLFPSATSSPSILKMRTPQRLSKNRDNSWTTSTPLFLRSSLGRQVILKNVNSCNPWFEVDMYNESISIPRSAQFESNNFLGCVRSVVECPVLRNRKRTECGRLPIRTESWRLLIGRAGYCTVDHMIDQTLKFEGLESRSEACGASTVLPWRFFICRRSNAIGSINMASFGVWLSQSHDLWCLMRESCSCLSSAGYPLIDQVFAPLQSLHIFVRCAIGVLGASLALSIDSNIWNSRFHLTSWLDPILSLQDSD